MKFKDLNLGMKDVTRITVERARAWKEESPMFVIEFKCDDHGAYNKYTWNTLYKQPKVLGMATLNLSMKEVIEKCNEIGLKYRRPFYNDPGAGKKIVLWSNTVSEEKRRMFELYGKDSSKAKNVSVKTNNTKTKEVAEDDLADVLGFDYVKEVDKKTVVRPDVVVNGLDFDKIKAQAEVELRETYKAQAKAQAEAELRAELEAEIKAEVEAEIKAKMEAELLEQYKREMQQEVVAKMIAEEKDRMRESVKVKLKEEMKAKLSGGVNPPVAKAVVSEGPKVVVSEQPVVVTVASEETIKTKEVVKEEIKTKIKAKEVTKVKEEEVKEENTSKQVITVKDNEVVKTTNDFVFDYVDEYEEYYEEEYYGEEYHEDDYVDEVISTNEEVVVNNSSKVNVKVVKEEVKEKVVVEETKVEVTQDEDDFAEMLGFEWHDEE